MENFTTKTIQEIVLENPASTLVFDEFKIDYCDKERLAFDEACRLAMIDSRVVSEKIAETLKNSGKPQTFEALKEKSLSELIDYIVEKHHAFTRDEIGRLTLLAEKVRGKHGARHPQLERLREVFREMCDELMPHMRKEELVAFPFVKELEREREKCVGDNAPFDRTQNSIGMMLLDHGRVVELLEKMREVTNDFTAPENDCPGFKSLYYRLAEFEKDLNQHIYLENELLFPRALKLGQKALFNI